MFFVGEPSILAKRLIKITQECLYRGIDEVKDGATLGDIGEAIQKHAENNRFSVVKILWAWHQRNFFTMHLKSCITENPGRA